MSDKDKKEPELEQVAGGFDAGSGELLTETATFKAKPPIFKL